MIRRHVEVCPNCGKWYPWVVYSQRHIHNQKRDYVKCKVCGHKDVIIWIPPPPDKEPQAVDAPERP